MLMIAMDAQRADGIQIIPKKSTIAFLTFFLIAQSILLSNIYIYIYIFRVNLRLLLIFCTFRYIPKDKFKENVGFG